MLDIAHSFRFSGTHNYVFTMDINSLYTVIPNKDGLLALTRFLNKLAQLQPPTHTPPSLSLIPTPSMATITNKLEALRWEVVSVPTMRVYSLATLRSRFSSSKEEKHLTSTSATLTI